MNTAGIIFEGVGFVLGSLGAAAALCMLSWNLFKVVRHPEWGPLIGLLAVVLLFGWKLQGSPFLKMASIFAIIGTFGLWNEGRKSEFGMSENLAAFQGLEQALMATQRPTLTAVEKQGGKVVGIVLGILIIGILVALALLFWVNHDDNPDALSGSARSVSQAADSAGSAAKMQHAK